MSTITNLAKSIVWDYKNIIVPTAVAIPLAVEGAILAKNIYQKPHVIKDKLSAAKNNIIKSFTIQSGENQRDAFLRIVKNSFILLSCLALMAGAAYASVILLPASLAITTAISSIFLIGKLFLNANEYKKQIVDMFTAREGEDQTVAKKRILKNILKTAAVTTIATAAIAIGVHFILMPMLAHGFTWQIYLPFQTKAVVFAEYASIGILNGGIAYHKWKKGDKAGAIYHLFIGALSFVFPAFYWNTDMRLHHSFYGLLMMTAPYRSLRMLGGIICFDSALYMLAPLRGYTTVNSWGYPHFNRYDFINTIVDNPSLYANGYAGSLMLENINDHWTEEKPLSPQAIRIKSPSDIARLRTVNKNSPESGDLGTLVLQEKNSVQKHSQNLSFSEPANILYQQKYLAGWSLHQEPDRLFKRKSLAILATRLATKGNHKSAKIFDELDIKKDYLSKPKIDAPTPTQIIRLMPKKELSGIYHHMWKILGCPKKQHAGEKAFHHIDGMHSTSSQKATAIRLYLNDELKAARAKAKKK